MEKQLLRKKARLKNLNRWILIAGCIVCCLFTNNANAQCSGTPSPVGTAAAAPTTICGSGTSSLSLTSYDTGLGITLQWQSSSSSMSSGGIYANVSGGSGTTTDAYTSGSISSTTYYTCLSTCSNTGDTSRSNENSSYGKCYSGNSCDRCYNNTRLCSRYNYFHQLLCWSR